jgi:outer membrane protein OmpA-like peptidoglycan-associated protein
MAQAMEGLFFNSGSSVILSKSYTVLDNVARIMNENPSYKLSISG